MESKHTKGDWQALQGDYFTDYKVSTEEMNIATVWAIDIPDEEAVANAKLIAAAPDLLSVLIEAVAHAHVYDTNPALIELFTAVINKATI